MTTSAPYLDSTLPALLDDARRVAAGPPIHDTGAGALWISDARYDVVRIRGRDRARFLHAMLSNDVLKLVPGEGRWATLNNHQGRTVTDVHLLLVDADPKQGHHLAITEVGAGRRFAEVLDTFVISEKVEFEAETVELRVVLGTESGTLSGLSLPEPGPAAWAHSAAPTGVRVVRWDDPDEFVIFGPAEAIAGLDAQAAALGLRSGSDAVRQLRRVRRGTPRYGIDWTDQHVPLEAGLRDRAISFTKGCYIGQEVICRLDAMGTPPRRIARVQVRADRVPEPGTALVRDGKEAGNLTSVVPLGGGAAVALAVVRKAHLTPGTILSFDGGEAELLALVE